MPLWAVHLSDGVLMPSWQLAGYLAAGLLFLLGAWRIREEDIPPTALLGSVFFVASLIHVRLGPSSVHLLLNGLLGVTLGRRAALAIPVGLFLQAALLGHGGFGPLGVTSCILVLPALLAGAVFRLLRTCRSPVLIGACVFLGAVSLVYSVALLLTNPPGVSLELQLAPATQILLTPWALVGIVLVTAGGAWLGARGLASEFALGLLIGQLTVLLTLFLQAAVLVGCGEAHWHSLGVLLFVIHLPIGILEGVVLGFSVGFLARVKPELLGMRAARNNTFPGETACSRVSLS